MANKTTSEKNKPTRKTLRQNEFYNPKTKRYEYHYKDIYGKQRVISSYRLDITDQTPKGKNSTKSLREKEEEINRLLKDNIDIDGARLTLFEMTNRYIESLYNKKQLAYGTKQGYSSKLKELPNHKISNMRICDIKVTHCEDWLKEMKQKYRGSSIKGHIGLYKRVFDYAIDCDYVTKNPFKKINVSKKDSKKMSALTLEEMNNFLEFCSNDTVSSRYYNMLYVLFWTGMRVSEMCGLTLDNVDMDNRVLTINKQFVRQGKIRRVSTTKTFHSIRTIPMTDRVYNCFKDILQQRKVDKEEICLDEEGNTYSGFVFLSTNSHKPVEKCIVESYFATCIRRYNKANPDAPLRMFYPHTCRHTFATNMQTISFKTLQTVLGHNNISTTLDYYVDAQPIEKQREEINSAVELLEH